MGVKFRYECNKCNRFFWTTRVYKDGEPLPVVCPYCEEKEREGKNRLKEILLEDDPNGSFTFVEHLMMVAGATIAILIAIASLFILSFSPRGRYRFWRAFVKVTLKIANSSALSIKAKKND